MKLSIIIPTLNESKNMRTSLCDLCDREVDHDIEIIVSESNGSVEPCKSVCNDYQKVKYFKCPDQGRAKQMNFGSKMASGDVLLFLHADVRLPANYYLEIEKAVKEGHVMGFFSYVFDKNTPGLRFNSYFTKWDGFFAGGGDQCQFFVKSTFSELGGYDEDYCVMEDFQMTRIVKQRKLPFKIINKPATVSARKYENNSWLRVNAVNLYVLMKFKLGAKPDKLKKLYSRLLISNS